MVLSMSALPLDHGATFPVGSRPLMAAIGAVGRPFAHMLDLAQFLPIGATPWTDALISETRRHLAGCLGSVEAALHEALADTALSPMLVAAKAKPVWQGVQANPQLVGPDLIAQMRMRAAIGLLGRQAGFGTDGPVSRDGEDISWLHYHDDPKVAEQAAALALAEMRWAAPDDRHAAMPADLPAEAFADIVWTVAALIATEAGRAGFADPIASQAVIAAAAADIIAGHDESGTPIARASRIARLMRGRADEPMLLGQALAHRRILLFAAFAGERAGLATEAVLDALVHAPLRTVVGLCHVLGGSASDCRHLLLQVQPVRRELDDACIIAMSEAFDALSDAEAHAAIAVLSGPAELKAKIALIDPACGG
jgi:hypothetical protein